MLNFLWANSYGQSKEDSIMIANSEKWNVVYKKGILTLSQPGSAQIYTMNLTKLDSGTIKHKKKDSSDIGFSASREGMDWDQSKYMTITKNRVYKLQSGNDENATQALFSVAAESKEKRQTLFGKMLSKSDEGKDEVLSFTKTISGIIRRNNNTSEWKFNLNNVTNSKNTEDLPFITSAPVSGTLKDEKDSLFLQPSSFNANAVLVNSEGDHLAAIKFRKKPFIMWVREDIDNSLQDAIGVLFAIIIGMKEK
jgi:hypothetical protein